MRAAGWGGEREASQPPTSAARQMLQHFSTHVANPLALHDHHFSPAGLHSSANSKLPSTEHRLQLELIIAAEQVLRMIKGVVVVVGMDWVQTTVH